MIGKGIEVIGFDLKFDLLLLDLFDQSLGELVMGAVLDSNSMFLGAFVNLIDKLI